MLSIRLATATDIPLIRELTFAIWPHTYGPILIEAQIAYMLDMMYSPEVLQQQMKDGHTFQLCFNDDLPIGFAGYGPTELGVFKLHKLYLLPDQQGKGAGKFIMNHVIEDIWDLGATALILNVNRHNHTAKAFYDRMGFSVLYEDDIDIDNGYFMNDYIMQLVL